MPIDFGGGMIFPNSYGGDEFSRREEERQRVEEQIREQIDEDTCKAHGKFACEECFDTGSDSEPSPDPGWMND